MRLGMLRQEAIRKHTHVGIQHRIDRHCDQVTGEMHLLALCRQLANSADPLAHELPVGHPVRTVLLHGLRAFVSYEGDKNYSSDPVLLHRLGAFVTYEGDKDHPGDQDERQDHTDEQSKDGKNGADHCLLSIEILHLISLPITSGITKVKK